MVAHSADSLACTHRLHSSSSGTASLRHILLQSNWRILRAPTTAPPPPPLRRPDRNPALTLAPSLVPIATFMLSAACSSPNIITFTEIIDRPRQNTLILPAKKSHLGESLWSE